MKILLQLAFVLGVCLVGEAVSALLPFTFPGGICAMLILLALLCTNCVKTDQLNPVGNWFQRNMSFFFLPANISILEEFDLVSRFWLHILFIGIVSTIITFAAASGAATLAIVIQKKITHRQGDAT